MSPAPKGRGVGESHVPTAWPGAAMPSAALPASRHTHKASPGPERSGPQALWDPRGRLAPTALRCCQLGLLPFPPPRESPREPAFPWPRASSSCFWQMDQKDTTSQRVVPPAVIALYCPFSSVEGPQQPLSSATGQTSKGARLPRKRRPVRAPACGSGEEGRGQEEGLAPERSLR